MVGKQDIKRLQLNGATFQQCAETVVKQFFRDRDNLHSRDSFERLLNMLMGEVAEYMVIQWLQDPKNKKYVERSNDPDFDLQLECDGRKVECSVKSSLSYEYSPEVDSKWSSYLQKTTGFWDQMHLASTYGEVRDINVQVSFWLTLRAEPRLILPSLRQAAIIAWFDKVELTPDKFTRSGYSKSEERPHGPLLREGQKPDALLDRLS